MPPSTQKQWTVEGKEGFSSLKLNETAKIPPLGERDVLVRFHYASLNYRDLIITKGQYPFPTRFPIVPCSDGAGTIEAIGSGVTRFKKGDNVITLFNQGHIVDPLTPEIIAKGVGGMIDGTLTQYGKFDEEGLVPMPQSLNFQEASTLTCAAVTAWNCLFGVDEKRVRPGDTVLTQGTGGVSLFGVQFAKAVGAKVIATTGSNEKIKLLKSLGADVVLNHKEMPKWGEEAKKQSRGGLGVDHVIEVGGPQTIAQSFEAIKTQGVITVVGFLAGTSKDDMPSFLECLNKACIVRGVLVGSRTLMEEMCRAIDAWGIKPVVDEKVWGFGEAREAYEHMWAQRHVGKLTVRID